MKFHNTVIEIIKKNSCLFCNILIITTWIVSAIYLLTLKTIPDFLKLVSIFFSGISIFMHLNLDRSRPISKNEDLRFSLITIFGVSSVFLSGLNRSPLLLPLFAIFACTGLLKKKTHPFIYSIVLLLLLSVNQLITDAGKFTNYLNIYIAFLLSLISLTILLTKLRQPECSEKSTSFSSASDSTTIEDLWSVLDLLRDLERQNDINAMLTGFLQFLKANSEANDLLLLTRKEGRVLHVELDPDGKLQLREVEAAFDFEKSSLPQYLSVSGNQQFLLGSHNTNYGIYLKDSILEKDNKLNILAAELLLESITKSYFSNLEEDIYTTLLDLNRFLKKDIYDSSIPNLIEGAVTIFKRFSFLAKVFGAVFSIENEKLILDSIYVRGKKTKYPEELWKDVLTEIASEAYHKGITTRYTDRNSGLKVFCVPVGIYDQRFIVLGGVTEIEDALLDEIVSVSEAIASALKIPMAMFKAEKDSLVQKNLSDADLEIIFFFSLVLFKMVEFLRKIEHQPEITDKNDIILLKRSISKLLRQYVYEFHALYDKHILNGESNAISSFINYLKNIAGNYDLEMVTSIELFDNLRGEIARDIMIIIYEIFSNAILHSGASSALLKITSTIESFELYYEDKGAGFDPNSLKLLIRANPENYRGLRTISALVKKYNGFLNIKSQPGEGVKINLKILLNSSGNKSNES